jgi:hypothetical protein
LVSLLPKDSPKPLGKAVTTITYTDANLCHDMLTGRSVKGILHLCNKTLVDWYSKRQAKVETTADFPNQQQISTVTHVSKRRVDLVGHLFLPDCPAFFAMKEIEGNVYPLGTSQQFFSSLSSEHRRSVL